MSKKRSMVKLIHADGFFPNNDAENLQKAAASLIYLETKNGLEVQNFNLIFPDSEIIFHKVLGERVIVDTEKSGVIRKPYHNLIHFEDFETTEEWCFMVALEPTTVNFWYHIDDSQKLGEWSKVNAKTALEGTNFNYKNLFEWKIHTNILLETNQCLFYRPWVFHSLEEGMIQYYRLLADKKIRILVMGLPGSKRASIAHKLNQIFESSSVLRSIDLRHQFKDLDFSVDGQMRHCYRILNSARNSKTDITFIDMVCPLPKMRQIINADAVIWVSDKGHCQYDELNRMFVPPVLYDIECKDDDEETIENIVRFIISRSNTVKFL